MLPVPRAGLALAIFLVVMGSSGAAHAQTTFQDQSERLQLINAYLLDFRSGAAPVVPEVDALELGLQITHVPDIDTRVGLKDEKVDVLELIPRPRARYVSALGWFVGASYTPPLEVREFKAHIAALEAGFRIATPICFVGLRGSATIADTEGPITEQDVEDRFRFVAFGGDVSVGATLGDVFTPYGGGGVGSVRTRLDVEVDGVKLTTDEIYPYGFVGGDLRLGQVTLNFEQHFSDTFLSHFWVGVSWRF